MRLTVKMKKFIALFMGVSLVLPLATGFELFDRTDVSAAATTDSVVDNEALMQAIVDSGVASNLTVAENGDIIATSADAIDKIAENVQMSMSNTVTNAVKADDDDDDDDYAQQYTYKLNSDSYTYDFFSEFTFDGEEYQGHYNADIKKTENNLTLQIDEIGTVENPYVILELAPGPAASEMRSHVGDQGLFDLTQEEIDAITLTDKESQVVRLQLLYQLSYDKDEEIIKEITGSAYGQEWLYTDAMKKKIEKKTLRLLTNYNARGTVSIEDFLTEYEQKIVELGYISEEEFEEYLTYKLDTALDYKITQEKAYRYYPLYIKQQYKVAVDYMRQYDVNDDGEFVIYDEVSGSSLKKTYKKTTGDVTTNAYDGEYAYTTYIHNPFSLAKTIPTIGGMSETLISNHTFRKGCLDLAFNTYKDDSGKATNQDPYIDEYAFRGWYVWDGNELVKLTKDNEALLKETSDLYTSWSVRYFESDEYTTILPSAAEGGSIEVRVGSGSDVYTVHLPTTIASANARGTYHDPRNQLFMCVPVKARVLKSYSESIDTLLDGGYDTYVEEFSCWDFDFVKSEYDTYEKLMQVAPMLMPDTDYYVATYNQKVSESGTSVTYYPYNVQVLTVSIEELNKLVYASYAKDGIDPSTYADASLVDEFLKNVDFVFFSSGNNKEYSELVTPKSLFVNTDTSTRYLSPNINRAPQLYYCDVDVASETMDCTFVSQSESYTIEKKYVRKKTDSGQYILESVGDPFGTYSKGNSGLDTKVKIVEYSSETPDLEWQVAYGIYLRTATPVATGDDLEAKNGIVHQGRRIAMIINETVSSSFTRGSYGDCAPGQIMGASGYTGNGSFSNMSKMFLMIFGTVDPTQTYDFYVRDRNELKILAQSSDEAIASTYDNLYAYGFEQIKSGVRGESDTSADSIYKGSRYTGYLYGYEMWNAALLFPFEIFYDLDSELNHRTILNTANERKYTMNYAPWQEPAITYYHSLGIGYNTNYKNIANPFAYTFNGDNDLTSTFYVYNRAEISNPSNGYEHAPNGNTSLAFDYFREMRPSEIKNDKIATKSAIEFMVQNSQNGAINYKDRFIEILNSDFSEKYRTDSGNVIKVDTVVVDDFSKPTWNINFRFTTNSKTKYYVTEYLWTKSYIRIDNDNVLGTVLYGIYTNLNDDEKKWYIMPEGSMTSDADEYFKTKLLQTQVVTDDYGNNIEEDILTDEVKEYIVPETKYYFDALILPNVLKGETDATYMIAVKQYESKEAYESGKAYLSVTVKNVALDRMSHLFNLD